MGRKLAWSSLCLTFAVMAVSAMAPGLAAAKSSGRETPHPPTYLTVAARSVPLTASQARAARTMAAVRAAATPPSPPFTECPAIGNDTSCGVLVDVTNGGQAVYSDPNEGPYDGADDTLIGVVNDSSSTVTSLQLSGNANIFGFDGDGICTGAYYPEPSGCPFGPTEYEGPGTSFSNINASYTGGDVNFSPGIPPGGTAYFSLEEPLSAATVFSGGPSSGEQGSTPNESEKPTTCHSGAPVNCATGAFWHTFTDASIPGPGVPLDFTRTYSSSASATNGPLGYGWTDSYDMSLSFDASGDATVTQEDGSTVTFDDVSGSYIAPPRVLATFYANGDGTYTFSRDSTNVQYVFNSTGQLIREVDRDGYVTTLAYDGTGELSTITDQAGRSLTLAYSNGRLATLTDPMGNVTTFSYDANGNLVSTSDPLGRTWSFTYDANHLLLSMTDPRQGTTTNTYDSSDRVVQQVDPAGRKTSWAYSGDPTSSSGGTTTITDPRGIDTTYTYSDLELISVTRGVGTAAAATTSYTYDPATLGRATVTDPDGNVTTNTYDSRGDLTGTTDPLGNVTQYTYDGEGDLLSETDALGTTTSYGYDGNGNLVSKSTALSAGGTATWTYAYGSGAGAGELLSATNPDGKTTSYGYDSDGDQTSVTNPLGQQTVSTYDTDGRLLSTTTPAGHTTSYVYDAGGERTKVTDALGKTTSYSYDADGNQASITDANGHRTAFAYDADNEQVQVTEPNGNTSTTSYDRDGNTLTQTDGRGATTTYTYDPLGRVASSTDADRHTTTDTYDAAGNLLSTTDPSGRATTYTYDADNRVTGISYSDGTTPGVTEAYDADGHRISMTDGTGTSTFAYDTLGHLTSQRNGASAATAYTYDPAGNLTSIQYPNGQSVNRTYDDDGRLQSVSDWLGSTTSFGYDGDGNLTNENLPGSVTSSSTYDAAGRLTGITDSGGSGTIAKFGYTRDAAGQLTSTASTGAVSGSDSYSYDAENRLTGDSGTTYGYDAANDPTTYGGQPQTFDPADELQTSGATVSTSSGTQPTPSSTAPAVSGPGQGSLINSPAPIAQTPARRVTIESIASTHKVSHHRSLAASISTKQPGDLLLAFVSAQGAAAGQTAGKPTSRGLTWTLVTRNRTRGAIVAIWSARATHQLMRTVITAGVSRSTANAALTILAFAPGATVGATSTVTGRSGAPQVSVSVPTDGMAFAVGSDVGSGAPRRPLVGNRLVEQHLDHARDDAAWLQSAPAGSSGMTALGDRAPRSKGWLLAAVVIRPAATLSAKEVRSILTADPTTGPRTFGYNAEGDRTSVTANGTTVSLGYDQANRLVGVGPGVSYSYDGDGLRAAKTVDGTTTPFTWDESGSLPLLLQDGATSYIYGPGGQAIEEITGSTATYLLSDTQGSTRVLTDAGGTVVGTYTYDAWGNVRKHSGSASTNLQYDGQYTDPETGYQYLRARYYDPTTGQMLTVDPLVTGTGRPYSFAADDPANLVDRTGLFAAAPCANVSFAGHLGVGLTGTVEICDYTGDFTASTITVHLGAGFGIGGGVTVGVSDVVTGATHSSDLAGLGCPDVSASGVLGGGGNVSDDLCLDSTEVGVDTGPEGDASASLGEGYTYVISSDDGYTSKAPSWVKDLYNKYRSDVPSQSQVSCGPLLSGNPAGPPSDLS